MNRNRLTGCIALLTFAIGMMAQTRPARVESPIVTEKDFVWYVEQKNAWREATQRNPQDEEAWKNYYDAARYMSWFGESSDSLAREVVREMRQAIPNTYTYNINHRPARRHREVAPTQDNEHHQTTTETI